MRKLMSPETHGVLQVELDAGDLERVIIDGVSSHFKRELLQLSGLSTNTSIGNIDVDFVADKPARVIVTFAA